MPAGVRAIFTTRLAGASAPPYDSANLGLHVGDDPHCVAANRAEVAQLTGRTVCYLDQVHSATVIERFGADGAPRADGHVTSQEGLALAIMTADCAAIVLADPVARVIGAAHAGRAGMAGGIVGATVAAMSALGAQAGRIHAVIGPTVCGRCYELPAAIVHQIGKRLPSAVSRTRSGAPALDIPAGVTSQLRDAGVAHVHDLGICTMEEPRCFSHRREAGRTGRMAGIVWLA